MAEPTIRAIGIADVAPLAALHSACFADEPWRAEAMAEVLAMPGAFGFLASVRGAPIGFLLALDIAEECEILTLGVLPRRRRRGVARRLMERLLAAAARPILLEVAEDNRPALTLYECMGFVVVGRRPAYYRRANAPPAAALTMRCTRPAAPLSTGS